MAGENGAGRRGSGVVRGCPMGTDQDRCEWHVSGTAGQDDARAPWRRWLHLDWRVRPVFGDHRLVGKRPEGSQQPGGETRTPQRPSPPAEVREPEAERPAGSANISNRFCPLLSVVHQSAADPARTATVPVASDRGRIRLRRLGLARPALRADRTAGYGGASRSPR
jgi:hypothetical protein